MWSGFRRKPFVSPLSLRLNRLGTLGVSTPKPRRIFEEEKGLEGSVREAAAAHPDLGYGAVVAHHDRREQRLPKVIGPARRLFDGGG
jgi:hypothetical protein